MDPSQTALLNRLSKRILSTIDMTDLEIRACRSLVRKGLACDYADFYRRRTPTHLRLWGISPTGKTLLAQQARASSFTRKTQLDFGPVKVTLTEISKPERTKHGTR